MTAAVCLAAGAASTAADTFALFVQGVDYSDPAHNVARAAIPIDTFSFSRSLTSTATAEFTIEDPAASAPVPEQYADVLVWDKADGVDKILFSGMVLVTTVSQMGIGRRIVVSCVDYGFLLDRRNLYTAAPTSAYNTQEIAQSYGALAGGTNPLSFLGTTNASPNAPVGDARIACGTDGTNTNVVSPTALGGTGAIRGLLDTLAQANGWNLGVFTTNRLFLYVDPYKRVNMYPMSANLGAAVKEVVSGSPTASQVVAEDMEYTLDGTSTQTEMWATDTEPATGPYTKLVSVGSPYTNGHSLSGSDEFAWDFVVTVPADYFCIPMLLAGPIYPRERGAFSQVSKDHWEVGTVVTITCSPLGLTSRAFLVQSVDVDFLAGDGTRRTRIAFGGGITPGRGGEKPSLQMLAKQMITRAAGGKVPV